jgi:very-short-patch-repair endonuclease
MHEDEIPVGRAKDLRGKVFGRLTVLYRVRNIGKNTAWMCECSCGTKKIIAANSLIAGKTQSCGCLAKEKSTERIITIAKSREKDLTGMVFTYLTVLYPTNERNGSGRRYWHCKCKCGTEVDVIAQSLIQLNTKSCGCYSKEVASKNFSKDITNQRFGKLTAVKATNNRNDQGCIIWECQCDCGNITYVPVSSLTSGNTSSCGKCEYHLSIISKDLIGKSFGKLTVIERTSKRANNGEVIWKVKCECGNYNEVRTSALTCNGVQSCGCISSLGESETKRLLKENHLNFIHHWRQHTCRFSDTGRLAEFDFYIVDGNYIIEFDGIQHYQTKNSGWDTQEHLEKTQAHDIFKTQWCRENGIPLIRIPYWKLDTLCIEDLMLETTKFRVV